MVICEYRRTVSKDNKPFKLIDKKVFKTSDELTAHRVIKKWNDRGSIKTETKIMWRYSMVVCRPSMRSEIEDNTIPYHTESDC